MGDSASDSVGVDRSGETTRQLVRERDECVCQHCGIGEERADRLEVHHIHAVADDGTDALENPVLLCNTCHYTVHYVGPENGRYPVELAAEQSIDENDYQNSEYEVNGAEAATLDALREQQQATLDELAVEVDYHRQGG